MSTDGPMGPITAFLLEVRARVTAGAYADAHQQKTRQMIPLTCTDCGVVFAAGRIDSQRCRQCRQRHTAANWRAAEKRRREARKHGTP